MKPSTFARASVLVGISATLASCDRGQAAAPVSPPGPDASAVRGTASWSDVAPIIEARCVPCHTQGGVAPFALETYDEARARHAYIAGAVAEDLMPPWLPAEGCGTFLDPRRLSPEEKTLLLEWALGGAAGGTPSMPAKPTSRRSLSRIDRSFEVGADYLRPANAKDDDFRCFMIVPASAEDLFITGWDVVPSLRSDVLEVQFSEVDEAEARAADAVDQAPGWACRTAADVPSTRTLGGWASGSGAVHLAPGLAARVRAGRALSLEVHYHRHDHSLSREGVPVRTAFHVALGPRESVRREVELVTARLSGITILPLRFGHEASGRMGAPVGSRREILAIQPRMHKLGRSFHAELVGTSGEQTCLIDVLRWDYHWEEPFFLRSPMAIDERHAVELRCSWDNPTERIVHGGPNFDDESCAVSLLVARE